MLQTILRCTFVVSVTLLSLMMTGKIFAQEPAPSPHGAPSNIIPQAEQFGVGSPRPDALLGTSRNEDRPNATSAMAPLGPDREEVPFGLTLVERYGGTSQAVAVVGALAYIGAGPHVWVVDVHQPANPTLLGQSPMLPEPVIADITVSGTVAYVANGEEGVQVLSLQEATSPTLVGSLDVLGEANEVVVQGARAYVAASNGLHILDVSNPVSPVLSGAYYTPRNLPQLFISGTLAYLPLGEHGLEVVDIANPLAPTQVAHYQTPWPAVDVAVQGPLVYIAEEYATRFEIVDFSTMDNPSSLGTYFNEYSGSGWSGVVQQIEVFENRVYLGTSSALQIVDVNDHGNPTLIGTLRVAANDLQVVGTWAYVVSTHTGLQTVNVSNPGTISRGGQLPSLGTVNDIKALGNRVYITALGRMAIFDTTIPENPQLLGSWTNNYYLREIVIDGDTAYIQAGRSTPWSMY